MEIMTPVEESQIVILAALFLGIVGRTYLYYIVEKRRAEKLGEPPLTFDKDFIITAVIAAVGSGFVAMLTYPQAIAQVPEGSSLVGAFVIVIGFAFGSNEILNKVLSFIDFNRLLESPKIQEIQKKMSLQQKKDGEKSVNSNG